MSDVALFRLVDDRFEPYLQVASITRATNYADGFFDTILMQNGKPTCWKQHEERIHATVDYLGLGEVNTDRVLRAFDALTTATPAPWQRVRLNIYRGGAGRYFPDQPGAVEVVAQIERLATDPWQSEKVLRAERSELRWTSHPGDRFKLLAKHEHVRFALEAQRRRLDELFIINQADRLVGCVAGNVLLRLAGAWYSPTLSDGALAGTVRQFLLEEGLVQERSMEASLVDQAEAFARTNSITGVMPIGKQSIDAIQPLREALRGWRN